MFLTDLECVQALSEELFIKLETLEMSVTVTFLEIDHYGRLGPRKFQGGEGIVAGPQISQG